MEDLPDFIYTDKRPGTPVPTPSKRVKDLPPDCGIRTKPILYFYPQGYMTRSALVGVEVRFADGYAKAWWPQVHVYRTPEQVARAKPVDWEAWQKKRARERWRPTTPIPDDERFELVWHNLVVTKDPPKGQALDGGDLPDEHWVRAAREVDAHYVSNGRELERFVFYEGATARPPAIAILPPEPMAPEHLRNQHYVVNVDDEPIYDVFAVYRDKQRGVRWSKYVSVLAPVPQERRTRASIGEWGHDVPQVMTLLLPDFGTLSEDDQQTEEAFETQTSDRLIEVLTTGHHRTPRFYRGLRDPADPQPPTRMHMLFEKEAIALERIWHADFFESEGLTILYRESPEALNRAMPLHIYTDMYHYVKLSRCGLVLNRNVPFKSAASVAEAARRYIHPRGGDESKQKTYLATCRQNRFLALGSARYWLRQESRTADAKMSKLIQLLLASDGERE